LINSFESFAKLVFLVYISSFSLKLT